mmetsp:Transcript_28546/g.66477  ORF Transcript_28546/g.66477 Transcript_28546/m.66477 type:complete len:265 (+) Transcript_28546:356-1150(+)
MKTVCWLPCSQSKQRRLPDHFLSRPPHPPSRRAKCCQHFAVRPPMSSSPPGGARNVVPSRHTSAADTGPHPGSAPCARRSPSASSGPLTAAPRSVPPATAKPEAPECALGPWRAPLPIADAPRGPPSVQNDTYQTLCQACHAWTATPAACPQHSAAVLVALAALPPWQAQPHQLLDPCLRSGPSAAASHPRISRDPLSSAAPPATDFAAKPVAIPVGPFLLLPVLPRPEHAPPHCVDFAPTRAFVAPRVLHVAPVRPPFGGAQR